MTSGRLALACPATTISLDDVYEGVELPPLRVREDGIEDDEWADLIESQPARTIE